MRPIKKRFDQLVPGDKVSVVCQLNQKSVDAEVVSVTKNGLVVVLPGFARLQMTRHAKQSDLYIANSAGLEFHCRVG